MANDPPEKEVEEELEDTWKGLSSDVYFAVKDELKNTYEQTKLVMRLN